MAGLWEKLNQVRSHNATDKDLSNVVRTALALLRTADQQPISSLIHKRKQPVSDRAALDAQFKKYSTSMDTKLGHLQMSLENVM